MVPNSAMKVAAIFKSLLLKMAAERNIYIFITELKLQVRSSMQLLHRYTLLMIQKSQFFDEKLGMRLKLFSAPLKRVHVLHGMHA